MDRYGQICIIRCSLYSGRETQTAAQPKELRRFGQDIWRSAGTHQESLNSFPQVISLRLLVLKTKLRRVSGYMYVISLSVWPAACLVCGESKRCIYLIWYTCHIDGPKELGRFGRV